MTVIFGRWETETKTAPAYYLLEIFQATVLEMGTKQSWHKVKREELPV